MKLFLNHEVVRIKTSEESGIKDLYGLVEERISVNQYIVNIGNNQRFKLYDYEMNTLFVHEEVKLVERANKVLKGIK